MLSSLSGKYQMRAKRRSTWGVLNVETEYLNDLFQAIGEGKADDVKTILEMVANPVRFLIQKDLQGLTPLKKAIALNKPEIARILVSFGAAPSVIDPAGRTALHTAVIQGRRELIAPLLVSKDSCVNTQDSHGWTPLHFAVRGNHIKAINWLLYAGADVNLKDKDEKTAMDLCEEDSIIRAMLKKYEHALDDGPLDLCSAFIGRKQLNQIGPDGLLMFVTSDAWSDKMQFIFCIRIRPYRANPPIPLRLDEQYYSDVWHYRMMRRLSVKERRVKAYFRLFEDLGDWEIVLKVTSKKKFLGEVPVNLSRYTQYNYTSFLACAEMDLKDEGQFVMVKRPISYMLLQDDDGMYANRQFPMFRMNVPEGSFPKPPANWNNTRYDREWEEKEAMMKKLLPEEREVVSPASPVEKQVVWGDKNTSADVPDVEVTSEGEKLADESGKELTEGEEREPGEDEEAEEEEDYPGGIRPGTILEGDEPDDSTDFYFISKGWNLYTEVFLPMPLNIVIDKTAFERNIVRGTSLFYHLYHSSKTHPAQTCVVQIPKTPDFVKVGTVLVFSRRDLLPDEIEYPDPDDVPEENFLSSDGKNTWGMFWVNKEKERWSLIPNGIANKQSRVVFQTNQLSTFLVMQLTQGTQKWDADLPGESSSEEEDEEEAAETQPAEETSAGEETVEREGDQGREEKKKKRKKRSMIKLEIQEDSPDDSSIEDETDTGNEIVPGPAEDTSTTRRQTMASTSEPVELPSPVNKTSKLTVEPEKKEVPVNKARSSLRRKSSKPSENQQSARASTTKVKEPLNESDASNNKVKEPLNESDASNNKVKEPLIEGDASNNRSDSILTEGRTRANTVYEGGYRKSDSNQDDDEERLAPEQRTVVSGLPDVQSSYYKLAGMRDLKPPKPKLPFSSILESKSGLGREETTEALATEAIAEETGEGEERPLSPEEAESEENIVVKRERLFSLVQMRDDGSLALEDFKYGPPLSDINICESDLSFLLTEVAYLWRYRNHCECVGSVFARCREHVYDLVIELVKASELYVRAEHWWGEGYRMIAQTPSFPAKSGRLFTFLIDGSMIIDSPTTSTPGIVNIRSMFYYLSTVSCLEYVVRRANREDDIKGPGAKKGPKKKEDIRLDNDPDCRLDIMEYPPGGRTNGIDIGSLNIFLNGPDLWHQRHVELRKSDDNVLGMLIKVLRKERAFKHKWWRAIILLGYPEKEIETEKGKTKWSAIMSNLIKKWFDDNLNAPDRGILKLISVLDIMELQNTIERLLAAIREYKGSLITAKKEPRYLKLLFHWVLNTKITRNSLMRLIDTQILKPVSDIFLLRLAVLLEPSQIFKIGAAMDVEDNVIHAIQDEENIKDPVYFPFRVLIKSRQKKDEIIHYTLLLLEMTKQCNFQEAQTFLITETRKWMETVVETEADICAKLDNVFS